MGMLGSFCGAVKRAAKRVSKAVTTCAKEVVKKVAKCWASATGKSTFDEAEQLLSAIKDRYDKAQFKYDKDMSIYASKLAACISEINDHKTNIFSDQFTKFTRLASKIHNITVEGEQFLEEFDKNIIQIKNTQGVRSKESLYLIDFNQLKFKEITMGFLTLGFFTRKKAKQTLIAVQEEEQRINEELQKFKAQLKKTEIILSSIENILTYFKDLVPSYSRLLNRFEYGIHVQQQQNILNNIVMLHGKIDFKLMPIAHIEEFQALFNLSIVLKQMSTMSYLSEKGDMIHSDIKQAENIIQKVHSNNLMAA